MSNVYINHIVIIEHVKFGAIEIKLPSKVLHKVYIDFYVNFMQDFWRQLYINHGRHQEIIQGVAQRPSKINKM